MRHQLDDDLFKDTTMTFGEHLEELRVQLFKAIIGLAIGFLLGLGVGNYVVQLILNPLERSLKAYYSSSAIDQYAKWSSQQDKGAKLPYPQEEVERRVNEERRVFEIRYIDPQQLLSEFQKAFPQFSSPIPAPKAGAAAPSGAAKLYPILLWHSIDEDPRVHAMSLNPQEPFAIWMKASFLVGAVISSPWVFYCIWQFVAAGLYPHEKRYVHEILPASIFLFVLGASTVFLFVFDPVLQFFFSFNQWMGIDPDPRLSEWLSFVLLMPLGFGVAFQLPLVMLFLERIGIFTVETYISKWKISVLVVFVLAMVLTPSGDPWSMLLLAVPLTALYFGGIGLCRWKPRRRSPRDEPVLSQR